MRRSDHSCSPPLWEAFFLRHGICKMEKIQTSSKHFLNYVGVVLCWTERFYRSLLLFLRNNTRTIVYSGIVRSSITIRWRSCRARSNPAEAWAKMSYIQQSFSNYMKSVFLSSSPYAFFFAAGLTFRKVNPLVTPGVYGLDSTCARQ